MANFNKIMLMGNLTRDPQLSYTPSQTAVVEFGLAINRKWKGADGSAREETCFIDCQSYGRQAETLNKYMSKGQPIFIEGRLKFDSWTAQDGSKRSKHRVTIENFQFLGGPSGGQKADGGEQRAYDGGQNTEGGEQRANDGGQNTEGGEQMPNNSGGGDDIPF